MRKQAFAALSALSMLSALPAIAGQTTANMAVACDGVTIKSGASRSHNGGTLTIKQNSAELGSSTYVSARSGNGYDLSFKLVHDGTTATWTGVIANSSYTVRAYRDGSYQCNGILPGYGNYTLNYTFTTT